MRILRTSTHALRLAVLLALAATAVAQSDAAKDIKSKDAEKRLAAVDGLRQEGGDAAAKLLTSALLDKDWEVVEKSALALGEMGTKASVPQLVKTALDAPAARIRRAAARALARIDAVKATEDLAKQSAGRNALRAWQALALVAPHASGAQEDTLSKNLRKSQKAKERDEKLAAAGAIAAGTKESMLESLESYLGGEDIGYAAAALRSAAEKPDADTLPKLQAALTRKSLDDVLERRLIGTCATIAASVPLESVKPMLEAVCGHADGAVAARGMRLAYALAKVVPTKDLALTKLEAGMSHAAPEVRAAAVHAGTRLGDEASLRKARELAGRDKDGRVQLVAFRQLVEHVGVGDQGVFDLAVSFLKSHPDALAREEAAVALGHSATQEAVNALVPALDDAEWTVAACAAVSLGKTTQANAVEPLVKMSKLPDWKRRGAAIVGLCHVTQSEAVPVILAATADTEPAISKTASVYAKALTKQDLGADSKAWLAWWEQNGKRVRMWTAEETKERREKYGYAQSAADVFKDLDVIVLMTRAGGDTIQTLLDHEGIAYRPTAAAKHTETGLHPHAVYVANCPGEIEAGDIEHVAWFVRTGGYMFSSCWSLHEIVERVYPGVVRKYETSGEVLDTVDAEPIAHDSSYLKGVFEGGVEPQYNLEGAHLIEVLDRERCEVLVDSPDCATRWGSGNLAVWFRAGHGLILDSVNHFNNQGLTNATWLKEPEERQAYALDRMGMTYAEWRENENAKWWSNNMKAAERIFDRTALTLVTNFVRSKRLEEM